MPLVLFTVSFAKPNPRAIPGETRAVAAEPYVHVDDEAGNIEAIAWRHATA